MCIEFNKTWTETSLWPKEDIQSKILEKKIPIFPYFDHKLDLVEHLFGNLLQRCHVSTYKLYLFFFHR